VAPAIATLGLGASGAGIGYGIYSHRRARKLEELALKERQAKTLLEKQKLELTEQLKSTEAELAKARRQVAGYKGQLARVQKEKQALKQEVARLSQPKAPFPKGVRVLRIQPAKATEFKPVGDLAKVERVAWKTTLVPTEVSKATIKGPLGIEIGSKSAIAEAIGGKSIAAEAREAKSLFKGVTGFLKKVFKFKP